MPKILAATIDGRMTYCYCSPDQIGKGRCNHLFHQKDGEAIKDFINRIGINIFAEETDVINPSKDNEAINSSWNTNALEETREILSKGNCCIINQATGTGKSSIMSAIIDDYYKEQSLFISPQNAINKAFGDHNENSRSNVLGNLAILTYQSLLKNCSSKEEFLKFCNKNNIKIPIKVLCLDEIHHLSGEDKKDKKWKEAVENLIKFGTDENTLFVGATATIKDESKILDGRFCDKISSRISFEDAIEKGILKMPHIISKPDMDEFHKRYVKQSEDMKKREKKTGIRFPFDEKEFIQNMNSKFEKARDKAIDDKIAENDASGKSTNILIFSSDVESEEMDIQTMEGYLKKRYPGKNIECSFYDSTKNGRDNKPFFDSFCNGDKKDPNTIYVLATYDTLNEGVHSNASIIIQNRKTNSKALHDQQQGRVLDMKSSTHNLIIDNVGTYSGSKFHNYGRLSSANGTTYESCGIEEMIKFDYMQETSKINATISTNAQKSNRSWKNVDLAKTHIVVAHKEILPSPYEKDKTITIVRNISIGHWSLDNFFPIECKEKIYSLIRECKENNISSGNMSKGIYEIISKYPEYEEYLKIIK